MNDDFQYESDAKLIDRRDSTYDNCGLPQQHVLSTTTTTAPLSVQCVDNSSLIIYPEVNLNVQNTAIPVSNSSDEDSTTTDPEVGNCQTAESEVKSLKEWLILHNDLIQQQNDEILEKEQQIYLLQRENEMLKERLLCIEKGVPYYPEKTSPQPDPPAPLELPNNSSKDMTQDSCGHYEEDSKENIDFCGVSQQQPNEDAVSCVVALESIPNYPETSRINNHVSVPSCDSESRVDTTVVGDNIEEDEQEEQFPVTNQENQREEFLGSDSFKTDSDPADAAVKDSLSEYNFTVNNFCEFDPMKNIKMSIRRKRISTSSALSANETAVTGEKKTVRRIKKKKRRLGKDLQTVTTKHQHYVSYPTEDLSEPEVQNIGCNSLEVPRWRVKVYTSCYTMEGTENLDDDVYNKRHIRLEINERRRKRWDVQRIREQRLVEKLKQRQDRIANGSKGESDQDVISTLWPKLDDIKYLEIVDELPVAAFGHPIPKIPRSDFCLPWLNNSMILNNSRSKRSNGRKRARR